MVEIQKAFSLSSGINGLVFLATASVEILPQTMIDQASHYGWTEANKVASAHVQPPRLCMVYNSWKGAGMWLKPS